MKVRWVEELMYFQVNFLFRVIIRKLFHVHYSLISRTVIACPAD